MPSTVLGKLRILFPLGCECHGSAYLCFCRIKHRSGTGTPSAFAPTCPPLLKARENVAYSHFQDHGVPLLVLPLLPLPSRHFSHPTHHQNRYPHAHHHQVPPIASWMFLCSLKLS